MKECTKCKELKLLDNFDNDKTKKSGKRSSCKSCEKIRREIYKSIGYSAQSTTKLSRSLYFQENKEELLKKQKIYKTKNITEYRRYQKEYRKERRKSDVNFRLAEIIRSNVRRIFKGINIKKNIKVNDTIDYSVTELKTHIEQLFTIEMNWENYGTVWELDHKIPIKWFIDNKSMYTNTTELCRAANTISNLQPLLYTINRSKGCYY